MQKPEILGQSVPIKNLLKMISRVAASQTSVLITGESGTGKELIAKLIHYSGSLKGKPFVPVNCGAIPENLIESEMFGHKKGSFTGAVVEKMGLFEAANGGTLFLDEVGELPLGMQVKLLRALQEKTIRKVGGNDSIKVTVRIIAATNRDLEAGIHAGTFREDLFYRLNVINIKAPALRERRTDIPLLANSFLKRVLQKQGKKLVGFEAEALECLEQHSWPGNVRELENVVERSVALEGGKKVTVASLPSYLTQGPGPAPSAAVSGNGMPALPAADFSKGALDLDQILGEVEKAYLMNALEHAGGVKKKAAQLLGITFRSIRYRLKKLGLDN